MSTVATNRSGAAIFVAASLILGLAALPTQALALTRLGNGVVGAVVGGAVAGPVGAAVGGGIGYTQGHRINRGFHRGYRHASHRRHYR